MDKNKPEPGSSKTYYCPECKKPLRPMTGKLGPFWGCSGFPKCRTTLNDVAGKPSEEVDEHYRCPLCTRRMVRAKPEQGDYWYCSGFARGCKLQLPDDDGKPKAAYRCPDCGNLLALRKGKNGIFWGCTKYPDCTATFKDLGDKPAL